MDTLALTLRTAHPQGQPASLPHVSDEHRPASVSAAAWESLARQMVLLQFGAQEREGSLHQSVREVVHAMRRAGEPWESVYQALTSAVATDALASSAQGSGTETHLSYAAALVSHMHCWADCERLEELERGA